MGAHYYSNSKYLVWPQNILLIKLIERGKRKSQILASFGAFKETSS